MTSSQRSEWPTGSHCAPEPPRNPTLTDAGGLAALQTSLDSLSNQRLTPDPVIDPNSFGPASKIHCQSIWYYFPGAALDDARDTIDQEHYWCLEAAMLLSYWTDNHPAVDKMSELSGFWWPSVDGGWRAIAISLRNELLKTGMSRIDFREIRLSCKHQAYFEIEHKHLMPIKERMELNHWLGRAQPEQNVLHSQTPQGLSPISQVVERAPVLAMTAMSPTQSTQPTQRKGRQRRQQDQNAARSTVTTSKSTLSKTKITLSKTTRMNGIGKTRVIGGKADSKKRRRTDGTRERCVK